MPHVLITTAPFAEKNREPLELLEREGYSYLVNPFGRRITEEDYLTLIPEVDALVAGTEPITARVMAAAPRLKVISRVGIGLDNVDLIEARARGIAVSYTPDAPSPAVAELTLGLMLSLLRGIHTANPGAHAGKWQRIMGRRLAQVTVGIIGVGRIGGRVVNLLRSFGGRMLAHDIAPDRSIEGVEWVGLPELLAQADVISIHVPLTAHTLGLIGEAELAAMKRDAVLINTARGGIVDEAALAGALRARRIAGAAIDVFRVEPYSGELCGLDNCLLTSHMGSMSEDCRYTMEREAVTNAIRFLKGEPLEQLVPDTEYALRASMQAAR
jgi:D-3-phosphoglycerate dehydrogenase / 2-oxoglutarate reductase